MPHSPLDNFLPPPLPPKPVNLSFPQYSNPYAPQNMGPDSVSPFNSSSHLQSISSMSAVERSRNLRIAKMNPHLQVIVGPLLRYDTIENGIWRGAALIVGECGFFANASSVPSLLNRGILDPDPHSTKLRMPARITTHPPYSDSTMTIPSPRLNSARLHMSTERPPERHHQNAPLPALTAAYSVTRAPTPFPVRQFKTRTEGFRKPAPIRGL